MRLVLGSGKTRAQRMVTVQCPNLACRERVVVSLDADRANCKRCGNQWPWAKSALLRGTRGA